MTIEPDDVLLQLAQQAIANGWPPEEVAVILKSAIKPVSDHVEHPVFEVAATGASVVFQSAFRKAASRGR